MNIKELEKLSTKLENELIKFKKIIEELKESQEESQEEQEHRNKRWRGKKNEDYYYILGNGGINTNNEDLSLYDNMLYDIGNYFKTEREAQIVAEKIKIYTKLKDLALRLNKGEDVDWSNTDQEKFCLYYSITNCKICQDSWWEHNYLGGIYCLDKTFKEEAIKEIGEENLRKLFEEEK